MLIGVDIGTSSSKAVLMRENGEIAASHNEEYGISTPRPGWAEQNPEVWLEKVLVCIGKVGASARDEIKGISFSGQMHGIVLVDAECRPVRDSIIWADSRSGKEVEDIASAIGLEKFTSVILNRAASGFGLPSLMWLLRHEPEAVDKASRFLCVKDYVRSRLVGEVQQETSDASSTCMLDIRNGGWAWDILDKLGLPRRIFPPLLQSLDLAGGLLPGMAERCGLKAGTPVYCGGSDNAMAGIGAGLVREGLLGANIGTAGQVGATVERPYFDSEFRTSTWIHPIPGRWSIFGAMLCGGLSLKWLRDMFMPGQSFAALTDLALKAKPGAGGVLFLPYLAGERTPWLDPDAKGMFFGLTLSTGSAEMCRAIMEGVVFSLHQSFELLIRAGVPADKMLSMGGGAKSALWPQIQADMFGLPIQVAAGGDASAGAAILAGAASGVFADVFEGVRATVRFDGEIFEPIRANHELYMEMKETFRSLYLNNRELFAG